VSLFRTLASKLVGVMGRDSQLVRALRPWYEGVLLATSRGRGIPWTINGLTYSIDPRFRHQMGSRYDQDLASWLRERVKPGEILLDVGANIGIYVLQFARWSSPGGRIVAVEPNPAARAVLERHIRMNGLSGRVDLLPLAVGASAGTATLHVMGTDGMSRLGTPNPLLGPTASEIVVPVATLDQICESRGIRPDWVLIDVEGFEIAALSGAANLLSARQTRFIVEMHPDAWEVAGTSRRDLESLLGRFHLQVEALGPQTESLQEWGHVLLRHDDT
jgi:FkbM family methyltransferase